MSAWLSNQALGVILRLRWRKVAWIAVGLFVAFQLVVAGLNLWIQTPPKRLTHGPSIVTAPYPTEGFAGHIRSLTRMVIMADRTFDIPHVYFDRKPDSDDLVLDSMLLEVVWPDMRASFDLQDPAERERITQERRIGWILTFPYRHPRVPLTERVRERKTRLTRVEPAESFDGLITERWYHGPPEAPTPWSEAHLELDSHGDVVSLLECRRTAVARFPSCSHTFIDQGLEVNITYNEAAFRGEWRAQRARAIALLRSFERLSK